MSEPIKPRIWTVEVSFEIVIQAETLSEARQIARANVRDVLGDVSDPLGAASHVDSISDLPFEWDGNCFPYGGDGKTPLRDLLPSQP